jgi:hypothetical protein
MKRKTLEKQQDAWRERRKAHTQPYSLTNNTTCVIPASLKTCLFSTEEGR